MDERQKLHKDECLSFLDALDEEDQALSEENHGSDPDAVAYDDARSAYGSARAKGDATELASPESAFRKALFARLHYRGRAALCFSGGGIRSATFGLGILQGLAARSLQQEGQRPALLGEFDYLSTVSGGGYLGSWFSAWATRLARPGTNKLTCCSEQDRADGPAEVILQLSQSPDSSFEPEPAPVKHLRTYSNYLAPKVGLLSADSWALVNTVIRNIILNWFVLLPLFAALILGPALAWRLLWLKPYSIPASTLWFLLGTGILAGAVSTAYIGFDLPDGGDAQKPAKWFVYGCFLPLSIAAMHLAIFWAWLPYGSPHAAWWDIIGRGKVGLAWWQFGVVGALMHGGGMAAGLAFVDLKYHRPPRRIGVATALFAALTGFAGGLITEAITHLAPHGFDGKLTYVRLYTSLAFPALMGVFLVSGMLLVGFTSYITEDEDREWWAFAGGRFLAVSLAWALAAITILYGGYVLQWVNGQLSAAFTAFTGISGWAAAKLAASASTPSGHDENKSRPPTLPFRSALKEYGARIFLPVFLILLTMLFSAVNFSLLRLISRLPFEVRSYWPAFLKSLGDASAHIFWLAAFYIAVCVIASYFINVNKFSLHGMYRMRLIRAFLGASNTNRRPNLFTNFDGADNMPMCTLTHHKPMHVVNMTLNLVGGTNLAWQQRKAESFTSTRIHTGSSRVGYRESSFYGGRFKEQSKKLPITLGTAITISGAAASPNMGYHSSPLLGIVMTLFNARLGWWLGNPKAPNGLWKWPGPRFGIKPFLNEALGLTNDQANWLYLSDGGHFENLGLYEMVLRRCRLIVVSDAGADPAYTYEDLANAIRKISIDLGIPIEFNPPSLPMSPTGWATDKFSGQHCAIADILYSAVDGDVPPGTLIYIKASRNGNEPPDVKQYAAANPSFPHQSTAEQFFNESQFESYRRLGLHIVEEICGVTPDCAPQLTLESFRKLVENYVHPPAKAAESSGESANRA
jgi:hypothetical protein